MSVWPLCLFKRLDKGSYIILLLYVDSMLVARTNMHDINELKIKLSNSFSMKDLGAINKILGMRITREKNNHKLTLSQSKYIDKVLERFKMKDRKPISTPLSRHLKFNKNMRPKTHDEVKCMSKAPYLSIVGHFMYVIMCTWLDIAHVVGFVSRYMKKLGK